ncbi:glycosyltransferase [Acerihabitans sp. KWT182]|uniref:Glycosyltransferase n=1 Tax=Acerihabitans sp. KWT182 TaxID=3157919 RepID=A0AAU7Q5E9_9GAMM
MDLREIPIVPHGIKELNLSGNALITLPAIHHGVKKLDVSHNQLEHLGVMPSTLEELDLTDNMFRELPFIGHPLRKLECKDNLLQHRIPKILHYIWLGKSPLPAFAVCNIINSAVKNPDYEVKVWVENTAKIRSQLINAGYSSALISRVKFIEPNLPPIIQSVISREGDHTQFANYAAASDVFRLYLLFREGGVYLDVDVAIKNPLGEIKSQSYVKEPMSDFLISLEYEYVDGRNIVTYGNAVMAAAKNSASASELLFEALSPYLATDNRMSLGILNNSNFIGDFSNQVLDVGFKLEKTNPHSRAFGPNMFDKIYDYDDVIWDLKKTNSLFRINLTTMLTGPKLLYRYFMSKGIKIGLSNHIRADANDFSNLNLPLSTITMRNSDIFGKLIKTKKGYVWNEKTDAKGRWVHLNNLKKREFRGLTKY